MQTPAHSAEELAKQPPTLDVAQHLISSIYLNLPPRLPITPLKRQNSGALGLVRAYPDQSQTFSWLSGNFFQVSFQPLF